MQASAGHLARLSDVISVLAWGASAPCLPAALESGPANYVCLRQPPPADCHKIVLQLEEKQIPYVIEKM